MHTFAVWGTAIARKWIIYHLAWHCMIYLWLVELWFLRHKSTKSPYLIIQGWFFWWVFYQLLFLCDISKLFTWRTFTYPFGVGGTFFQSLFLLLIAGTAGNFVQVSVTRIRFFWSKLLWVDCRFKWITLSMELECQSLKI